VIVKPDVTRAEPDPTLKTRLASYVGGGVVAGLLVGAALGVVGGLVPVHARAEAMALLALVAIVVGSIELTGRRVAIPQLDRETPFHWYERGAVGWALCNGAAIGFGGGTRLGFWLWFAIPVGAFVAGSPLLGALGYGLYSFTRTAGVAGLMSLERLQRATGVEVMGFSSDARILTSLQLVVFALLALVATGM
jgi:hypothetical protein